MVVLNFTAEVRNVTLLSSEISAFADEDLDYDAVIIKCNGHEIARSKHTDYLHSNSDSDVSKVAAQVLERLLQ